MSHGESGTRLYRIWKGMRNRCYNPNMTQYKDWGGRGITVCFNWRYTFEPFAKWARENGYADNLCLDRKENDKEYCPDNCQWVTHKVNNNNKNCNVILVAFGESMNIKQWSNDPRCRVSYKTLHARVTRYGMNAEDAITQIRYLPRNPTGTLLYSQPKGLKTGHIENLKEIE